MNTKTPKTSSLSKLLNISNLDEDTVLEYAAMYAWLREASINDKQPLFDRKDDVYGSYMDTYIMCKILEQQRQQKDQPKHKSYKKTVV